MESESLAAKVDGSAKNVFPAGEISGVLGFLVSAVSKENFTLTGLDSEESAKESAKLVEERIKEFFGREYTCSVKPIDENNYNLNCKLKNGK